MASGAWRITSPSGEVVSTPVAAVARLLKALETEKLGAEMVDFRRSEICEMLEKDPKILSMTGRIEDRCGWSSGLLRGAGELLQVLVLLTTPRRRLALAA